MVEALRLEQELQVLLAAVLEEVLDFFVALHGLDDLGLGQGARVVLVDHLEDLARRVQKLGRERGDLRGRLLGPPLAVRGALRQLRLERRLDRRFPLGQLDLARAVAVDGLERGLELRRHEQVLEVPVAAVVEELLHFRVRLHGPKNLLVAQRAAIIFIHEHEDLPRRVEERGGKRLVLRPGRALAALALLAQLLEPRREAPVDRLVPARSER